jgi:hypothetical protein
VKERKGVVKKKRKKEGTKYMNDKKDSRKKIKRR